MKTHKLTNNKNAQSEHWNILSIQHDVSLVELRILLPNLLIHV